MNRETTLTTYGKNTVNFLKDQINVENQEIDYKDPNQNLWLLNICISNFNSMLLVTYHGIMKMLPLYLSQFEWRFNHRNTKDFLSKITKYIQKSSQ